VDESGVAAKNSKYWGNMVLSRSVPSCGIKEKLLDIFRRWSLRYDCDSDALLIGVEQLGDIVATPVSAVVFLDGGICLPPADTLSQLFSVIRDRRDQPVESSYTANRLKLVITRF